MLRLYNTLTRKKEEFIPIHPPHVGYYSCGPTVYDFAHLGHARTYVFGDVLERVLSLNGYRVKRVMNITDVGHLTSDADSGEDKMEKGAAREKKTVWEVAQFYTDDFFVMLQKLHIKKPEIICRATDYIPQMIALIKKLEEKGYTYRIADGIYFDTAKLSDYGKLTGHSFAELTKGLKAGARIEIVSGKKHPTDFALWKLTPRGVSRQMEWDSPWGKGFPGWHIECSAMSMEFLGETFDIHTGGVDHIPIHHTNEIAQSEAATGKPFVRFWLHGEHLLVDNEKMSKSLGNFYRVSDVKAKGFSPVALRYLFLTAHYHTQMNFTWKSLEASQAALTKLQESLLQLADQVAGKKRVNLSEEKLDKVNSFRKEFIDHVNDDLNIPAGLAVVWKVVKSNMPSADKLDLLYFFDKVLGLDLQRTKNKEQRTEVPQEITELVNQREQFRKEKKWQEGDNLRREIEEKGFSIKDTPQGVVIKRK